MSSSGPEVDDALEYSETVQGFGSSFSQRVMLLLSGFVAFLFGVVMTPIEALVEVFVGLLDAFGIGGRAWILVSTQDTANFLSAALQQGAAGFSNTAFAELGPFLPWVGTIVAIGTVGIITWYLDRRDSDVVGLGVDLPLIGNDDDGDLSDEVE